MSPSKVMHDFAMQRKTATSDTNARMELNRPKRAQYMMAPKHRGRVSGRLFLMRGDISLIRFVQEIANSIRNRGKKRRLT